MPIRNPRWFSTAGHRLTLDPMGKCSNMNIVRHGVNVNETTTPKSNYIRNVFFSETINQTQSKLHRNVHWIVLYKVLFSCSDMKSKMVATAELSLTLDPMGKMFQNASSLKPLGQLKPKLPTNNHLNVL
jgi:hypothetical protein